MAENSKIQWTDHTFSPWRGCTKASEGCRNCYAEAFSGRNPGTLGVWGPQGSRVVAAESAWREPLRWQKKAKAAGVRAKVFCASLCDVFEKWDTIPEASREGVMRARKRLGELVRDTPDLCWLMLTKRPDNVLDAAQDMWFRPWREATLFPNVWIGASVEDQAAAEGRIPHLLNIPAAVRFLSCEPLLGPLDLRRVRYPDGSGSIDALTGRLTLHVKGVDGHPDFHAVTEEPVLRRVDWVIIGGESGHHARPFVVDDAREVLRQCRKAGTPAFFKQLGAEPLGSDAATSQRLVMVTDRKGGDPQEWPEDIRVREFPRQGG